MRRSKIRAHREGRHILNKYVTPPKIHVNGLFVSLSEANHFRSSEPTPPTPPLHTLNSQQQPPSPPHQASSIQDARPQVRVAGHRRSSSAPAWWLRRLSTDTAALGRRATALWAERVPRPSSGRAPAARDVRGKGLPTRAPLPFGKHGSR